MSKPRVFVASSREALPVAHAVQPNLPEAEVTVWDQDAFRPGQNVVDELVRNLTKSHFGVFVFSPDDELTIRGETQAAVRDNVLVELGMFIGGLGKGRSFIVQPEGSDLHIPVDLLGIISAAYDGSRVKRGEPVPALASACSQIKTAIKDELDNQWQSANQLIAKPLEAVCRAMSVPRTPEQASLRAFVFRAEEVASNKSELVCRHFWAANPPDELTGVTRFAIDDDTAKRVVVVRCYMENSTVWTEASTAEQNIAGNEVSRLPEGFDGAKGPVKETLNYVLAAPIRRGRTLWGVVDLDASNEIGKQHLENEFSRTVMLRFAEHLAALLSY